MQEANSGQQRLSQAVQSQGTERRAAKACDNCRRLKEKCNGANPCARCLRFDRECRFSDAYKQKRIRPSKRKLALSAVLKQRESPRASSKTLCDTERLELLEQIARQLTGADKPSHTHLRQALEKLQKPDQDVSLGVPELFDQVDAAISEPQQLKDEGVSREGDHYTKLSHQDFSRLVQRWTSTRLQETNTESTEEINIRDDHVSMQLRSQDSVVHNLISQFPPIDIAFFLLDVFFEFAQTNYSYIDEETLRNRLDVFYSPQSDFNIDDAAWVCIILMVFAIGTQFAHLNKETYGVTVRGDGTLDSTDETLALSFYRKATTLIPDVMAAASIQSVQAFVLLGVYTLPVDPDGLSCTYLGIAIKLATQNGLHLKCQDDSSARDSELRKRIWWAACTLERRICILHGRHVSINRQDIETDLPTDLPELRPKFRINTVKNVIAMIKLTDNLEVARDAILALRQCGESNRERAIQTLLHIEKQLRSYWHSLPEETYCRDLDPKKPLFRFNVHLTLTYHLVHIFIGRSFIMNQVDSAPSTKGTTYDELVINCVESAISVIDVCQLLEKEIGLAKSSYTEFTSCCAALIAVLAKRIISETPRVKGVCANGIELLKKMSVGIFSHNSERLAVESLEMAVHKLDNRRREASAEASGWAYMQFRNWVSLQQKGVGDPSLRSCQRGDLIHTGLDDDLFGSGFAGARTASFDINSGCPSFSLGEFVTVPGLDEWFEYGLR